MIRAIWVALVTFALLLLAWHFVTFPHAGLVYMALLLLWGLTCFVLVIVATGGMDAMDAQELAQMTTDASINYWHRGWIYPDPVRVEEEGK